MLALVLALAAAPGAEVALPNNVPARCGEVYGVRPAAAGDRPRGRRLGDLPPADHVLTVFRTIDRCPAPVIVRSDIGGSQR